VGSDRRLKEEFVLDTLVVSYFFRASLKTTLARVVGALNVAVVEEVDEELRAAPFGAEYAKWRPKSELQVVSIPIGSSSAARLAALRERKVGLKDFGEHASIAYAAGREESRFVTNDKNAIWIAANEFDGGVSRVVRAAAFIRISSRVVKLSRAEVDGIAEQAQTAAAPPTWCAGWYEALG
jgi:hypothetical protein